MKRPSFRALLLLCALSPWARSETPSSPWESSLGAGTSFDLLWNGRWDPGFAAGLMDFKLARKAERLRLEGGLELGWSAYGWQVLVPLGAGVGLIETPRFRLDGFATVLPGMLLNRPSPYFLLAGEITARALWTLRPGRSLGLRFGPRFEWSPEYDATVGPYRNLGLIARVELLFGR
ncbi:MAG: hypothetical protein J0L75_11655 [Spirochaetes bacterium]|nr:hypothetical protein [Spirochaetota bacterium]